MNLTPLARRRLNNFKANRRGYYSMWIFFVLFGLSLFAEFIANDKPIVLHINGETYFPVLEFVTEAEIGGELPIEADYADPFVQNLIRGGRRLDHQSHHSLQLRHDRPLHRVRRPAQPSAQHWLGTDDGAKDTLARLIYGFRLSVAVRHLADHMQFPHRRHGRRIAGLFRRLGGPDRATTGGDLGIAADAPCADYSVQHPGAERLLAADHPAVLQLDGIGLGGAGGVSGVRAISTTCVRRARSGFPT